MAIISKHTFILLRGAVVISVCVLGFACLTLPLSLYSQERSESETEAIELFNKGQDAHGSGDLRTALDFYEKALKSLPEFPEAELQRGNALLSLERLSEAEQAFRKAIKLRDDWSLARVGLARVLIRQKKFDEAKSILKKVADEEPDNIPALVALSDLAVRTGSSESELRHLSRKIASISIAPKPPIGVLETKALLEHALKEYKAAEFTASKALEIDPKKISMMLLIADLALRSNDVQRAEEMIRRIEAVDRMVADLPVLKARALLAAGRTNEAIEFIDSIKDPSQELVALRSQIVPSTAADIPLLEKKLETDARDIVALSRLCSLLRRGEPGRAIEFCRRAADIEPNNLDHAIGFGAALLQAKQYPQASALFQKLLNIAPENYTLRANFSTALFQQKRYTEAKIQFEWLTEKQPSNAAAYFFLAVVHDELGEYADAMANYQLFLKLADPKVNQLEIDKVNLRLPSLQRQLDAGKGRKNAKTNGKN